MFHIVESDKKKQKIRDVYLDYAAFAPVDKEVLKEILPYFDKKYGNASSMHESGRKSKQAIEEARGNIARIIGAEKDEIIFTSSGTESDNLAIIGIARAHRREGNHIIISAIEHKAVIEGTRQLKKEGFEISILPVDKYGVIDVEECIKLITDKTILISVMYVNNEIGTIEPIQELAKRIQEIRSKHDSSRGIYPLIHTDACQAANLLSLDVKKLGVDLMTLNSSKVYGPTGIGLLYKKSSITIEPIIVGGEQEKNTRAGTENLPMIVGLSVALLKAEKTKKSENKRFKELQKYFKKGLKNEIKDIIFNGHPRNNIPSTVHVSIPLIEGESMILKLDHFGIKASTGSACSSFDLKPSHVLIAIGQDSELIHGSIRFSMGRHTTKKDLDYCIQSFSSIVKELKSISALTLSK